MTFTIENTVDYSNWKFQGNFGLIWESLPYVIFQSVRGNEISTGMTVAREAIRIDHCTIKGSGKRGRSKEGLAMPANRKKVKSAVLGSEWKRFQARKEAAALKGGCEGR